jgi:hypothetical protein
MYRDKALRRGDLPLAHRAAPTEFLAPPPDLFEAPQEEEELVPRPLSPEP